MPVVQQEAPCHRPQCPCRCRLQAGATQQVVTAWRSQRTRCPTLRCVWRACVAPPLPSPRGSLVKTAPVPRSLTGVLACTCIPREGHAAVWTAFAAMTAAPCSQVAGSYSATAPHLPCGHPAILPSQTIALHRHRAGQQARRLQPRPSRRVTQSRHAGLPTRPHVIAEALEARQLLRLPRVLTRLQPMAPLVTSRLHHAHAPRRRSGTRSR